MIPAAGRRALVLGLGRFGGGREATLALLRRGAQVRVADRATEEQLAEAVAQTGTHAGLEYCLGREDAGLLDGVDLLVVNPAIPDHHPLLAAARARGVARTQEVDLALDAYPGAVVLVTGTNGKSTTATLLAAALRAAGIDALLAGNIGRSLFADEARWHERQVAVLEISSFQLARLAPGRRVRGAVLTRITADHLDRHGSLAAYQGAKAVAAAAAHEFLVHAADDPVAAAFASPARARLRFGAAGDAAFADGWLRVVDRAHLLHRDALQLAGTFQEENVQAAALAALQLGADPHRAALALVTQRPLAHRLQQVATVAGVRIYDNGVSTETVSTRVALEAVTGPIHWVGGGVSKDGDLDALAAAVAPLVRSAHLFGHEAPALARALGDRCATTVQDRLPAALDAALSAARGGDAVVFSPALASFDQYPNFRARAAELGRWLARGPGSLERRPGALE